MSKLAEINMSKWTEEDKKNLPNQYGCELIYDATTIDVARDYSLPSDSLLIHYKVNGEYFMDVCRGKKMADVFDLYYDKFGPDVIQKIEYGYGRLRPNMWGYTPKEKKRK